MARVWFVCLLVVTVTELTIARHSYNDVPFSRSLGLSLESFGKTLLDAALNQEYLGTYQEMIRASRESFEGTPVRDVRRLRSGKHLDVINDESVQERRHSGHKIRSAAGSRRARSQAVRRDKLNNQSLRSHQAHTRQSGQRND
ncbi:uncharacterized protein [Choristoneura fumiferana]|uniref:uncharacterized protein n=1 Tax=Choristoneura fumiferana TaxID=7141 RepID=UPI003D15B9B9